MKTFPGLKLLLWFIFVYKSHTCAYLWRSNDSHYFATTRIILSYSIDSVIIFFIFRKFLMVMIPSFINVFEDSVDKEALQTFSEKTF